MKANRKTIIIAISTLAAGIFLGWLFFGSSAAKDDHEQRSHSEMESETTWTCSMHPQIRQNEPGDCPICGMDLIPLEDEEDDGLDPMAIRMSETAMQLASISTAFVEEKEPAKTIRLNGKVQVDERLIFSQSSHIPGRIEKLNVNFTGEFVTKGQTIAHIYSPELATAQDELLKAYKVRDANPQLLKAAKSKLKNWKLSENQIRQIIETGKSQENFPIRAEVAGFINSKKVNLGDYISRGQTLYEITNLSRVWILLDIYESEIPWIKKGDKVNYTVNSLPGETFQGTITYIDPVIDPITRVASARIDVRNTGSKLKPQMFVTASVDAKLPNISKALIVPKSAVMWTGKRSVVYVKTESDKGKNFLYREVTLGPAFGDSYIIDDGLQVNEEIAVSGTFSIDAAAQLAGKPSMMSPDGGGAMKGHNHGAMQTENMQTQQKEGNHTSFKVGGKCGMCKDRIEKAALSVTGVTSAKWDEESQTIHLDYKQGLATDDIHKAIAKVGHDTEKIKAPDHVYEELPGCCHYDRFDYNQTEKPIIEHASVKVAGKCGMCKDRIEKAALSVEGVQSANWDERTQTVHLDFDSNKTSSEKIQQAIAKVGHDTEKIKAPDSIYSNLPECCLYDRLIY
ncbi:MAG: efflux RND transporter periplasmic adaptor subunit [Bacteroidales bacterium]